MKINQTVALFTLFHHNIFKSNFFEFDSIDLYNRTKKKPSYGFQDIIDRIFSIVIKSLNNFKDSEISITLTGGMDSRIILACLLKAGIKPNCLTFGNPNNHDVVLAKKIAENHWEKYRLIQDKLFESDFDRELKKYLKK